MRLLAPDHFSALTDALTWSDNPFVRRDGRRDRKKGQPLRSYAWMCGVMLVVGGLAFRGLILLRSYGLGNFWALGGDLGTTLCILLCGMHIFYIIGASQKHTQRMFAEEVSHNTLSSLLLIPASSFQLVLQSMVFPWLVGMRVAVILLPLYALCVGMGGISWLDLLMLYLVFALVSVTIPRWSQPILHENVSISTPTTELTTLQSRAARSSNSRGNNQFWGGWVSLSCFIAVAVMVVNRIGFSAAHDWLRIYLPESIIELVPTSLLSWPLILARGLVAPLNWYGHEAPPLPFALLFFVVARYAQVVRVSEWLQVGRYRDLAALTSYRRRLRLEKYYQYALAYVSIGYLWPWAIAHGGLSGLLSTPGPAGSPGLIGLVFLLGVWIMSAAGWRAMALPLWQKMADDPQGKPAVPLLSVRTAGSYVFEPIIAVSLLYLVACITAGAGPFPPAALALMGRLAAVGLAGIALRYGAAKVSGLAVLVGFVLPPLIVGLYAFRQDLKISLDLIRRLTYLSPAMGLLNLADISHSPIGQTFTLRTLLNGVLVPALPWYHWATTDLCVGLLLLLLAILSTPLRRHGLQTSDTTRLDPTRVGREAFMDAPTEQNRVRASIDSPLVGALIMGIGRAYDNAVLTRELRVRLRGKLMPSALKRTLMFALILSASLYYLKTPVTQIGMGVFGALKSNNTDPDAQAGAGMLTLLYFVMLILSPFQGLSILPMIFAVEREKSTLGFMLTTPLRSLEIAIGKSVGLLLPNLTVWAQMGIWTLLLSIVFALSIGIGTVAVAWCVVMIVTFSITLTMGMVALLISSLFPRRLTVQLGGSAQGLLVFGLYWGVQFAAPFFANQASQMEISGWWLLLFGIALALSIAVFCLLTSTLLIGRMRKGDILSGSNQRGN